MFVKNKLTYNLMNLYIKPALNIEFTGFFR
jgi:hypothetical protein